MKSPATESSTSSANVAIPAIAASVTAKASTQKKAGGEVDSRYKLIDRTLKRFQYEPDALIEVLHTAQEAFGFLSPELLRYVARQLKLPLSWVYGVATFYHFFSLKSQGNHSCNVCLGTACYVKRAAEILAVLQHEFDVQPGATTTDRRFSLNIARCLGSCGLAPVMVLDGEVLARQTPESALAMVHQAVDQGYSTTSPPAPPA